MQLNFKRTLGIAYIIAGCVWCIVNLPNLMARAKGNAIFATGLSLIRIALWPVFLFLFLRGKNSDSVLDGGTSNEDATTTTD